MATDKENYVTDHDPLLEALVRSDDTGIDTEFVRERTYFAQLCLVQVSVNGTTYIADPLSGELPASFWDTLLDRRLILHSGRQDLEVLYQATGRLPQALFDTQVAAALTGLAPQIGYANLVEALFGVTLSKSQTRADWSRRPLSKKMLDYAAEDVAYLLAARDTLTDRLEAEGRLEWALEDSAGLLERSLYEADPDAAVDRVKAARNLTGAARGAVVGLARWREERAIAADRPRQWILKDRALAAIAERRPADAAELSKIDGVPAGTLRRWGETLLDIVARAAEHDDGHRPPGRPDEADKARLKSMQKTVAAVASELGIAAEVIAPRKELTAIMSGSRDARVLSGWRRSLVGERLLALGD